MRSVQWLRTLQAQRDLHGKTVFSVPELCNLSGSSPGSINVELSRLLKAGVIERCAPGQYALPGASTPEALLPQLDTGAYITGLYALFRHNLVTQVPSEITCFTNRRHNRSSVRKTPHGIFRFVSVSPRFYMPPDEGVLAGPEQALCDWYLTLRRAGLTPTSQATLRLPGKIDPAKLANVLPRYPNTVRQMLRNLLAP